MPAHDILYKFVEELTGEPVDPSQYRPTFTGGMAALESALIGHEADRKETVSESLKSYFDSGGGGGGSSTVTIAVTFYDSQEGTSSYYSIEGLKFQDRNGTTYPMVPDESQEGLVALAEVPVGVPLTLNMNDCTTSRYFNVYYKRAELPRLPGKDVGIEFLPQYSEVSPVNPYSSWIIPIEFESVEILMFVRLS